MSSLELSDSVSLKIGPPTTKGDKDPWGPLS